jgi:hypothetical protein
MAEGATAEPWHFAYPQPRNSQPDKIDRADLLKRLQAGQKPGRDLLLIDLRRTDHEVSFNHLRITPNLLIACHF